MVRDFVFQVLDLFAEHDIIGDLFWTTDSSTRMVDFFVNCNDLFAWGSADAEEITPDSLDLLKKAIDDVVNATEENEVGAGLLLYCARVRGCRPQGAYYSHLPKETWPLFDACGPERTTGMGNPKPRPHDE